MLILKCKKAFKLAQTYQPLYFDLDTFTKREELWDCLFKDNLNFFSFWTLYNNVEKFFPHIFSDNNNLVPLLIVSLYGWQWESTILSVCSYSVLLYSRWKIKSQLQIFCTCLGGSTLCVNKITWKCQYIKCVVHISPWALPSSLLLSIT